MRCPHCAGEIQDGSRFCGICGRPTVVEPPAGVTSSTRSLAQQSASRPPAASSPSLFELPVAPGARAARIAIVLALDAILLIAGIAMIVSYLNERDRAQAGGPKPAAGERGRDDDARSVKFSEPVPLHRDVSAPPERRAVPQPDKDDKLRSNRRTRDRRRRKARTTRPAAIDAGVATASRADAGAARGEPSSRGADGGASTTARIDADASVDANPDPDAPTDAEVAILARQIRLVVNRERRLLQRCYNKVAKATTVDKALQGRVEIRFEVMPDGKTRNVGPRGNTTGSTMLAQCVSNLIRNWKFPSHSGKRSIPFVWPFDFRGS